MASYKQALSDRLRADADLAILMRHETGYWHPSALDRCPRESFLKHDGVEPAPFDDATLRNFWMGNKIHEGLQSESPFQVLGSEKTARIKDEEFKVSGRLDGLVINEGVVEAVEFKSMKDKYSVKYIPKREHILQLGCYLAFPVILGDKEALFPELAERWAERGRLVYWQKTDAEIYEFVVPRTDELVNHVKEALLDLEERYQDYKRSGVLPTIADKSSWQARWCNYRGTGRCCTDRAPVGDAVRSGVLNAPEGNDVSEVPE